MGDISRDVMHATAEWLGCAQEYNNLLKDPNAPRRDERLRDLAIRMAAAGKKVDVLRTECSHDVEYVDRQTSEGDGFFAIVHKCRECGHERTERGLPRCEACVTQLHKANVRDAEAEAFRKTTQAVTFEEVVVYKCPLCGKLHALTPHNYHAP